jgi:endonuclease III
MIIPYLISRKLGSFSLTTLSQLTLDEVNRLMGHPEPLHRFVDKMSEVFYSAIQRIVNHYESNAANIWLGKPLSAEVVYRFLEFEGVGLKIASMVTNILARDFRVPFADYFSIDISPDVHIRRVFTRLGLCPEGVLAEQVIYKAKALHPEFPGIMDLSCWDIGRTWCNSRNPKCGKCCMNDLCPTANRKK